MIIRLASFRDLTRVEQLYADALEGGGGQLHTDHPVPQAGTLIRLWYAVSKTLSSLVPISDGADTLLVAEDPQEGVVGFIQAQPAPGKSRAWQIVNLGTAQTSAGAIAADKLLTGICEHGQESDVSRFYVRLPLDHPLLTVFIEQRFTQYATEQILYSDSDPVGDRHAATLRTARRDDIGAINLLYLRVTPATVAAIEAPNRKAWEATFGGGVMARLGKDDVRHVVAENPGVYAWASIRAASAARPTTLQLMCETQNGGDREAFLDAIVADLPDGPVSCVLRHYDSELIRALQQRGFTVYGTQVLLAKDLAIKVRLRAGARQGRKQPVLVSASLARNVPAIQATRASLHVLDSVTRRGVGRSET